MIFNTALPASGGSPVSGWTDISSEFTPSEEDTEVHAWTDGTMVYLTASNPNGGISGVIELNDFSGPYVPTAMAVGAAVMVDETPVACYTDSGGFVYVNESVFGLTIIYPIAS